MALEAQIHVSLLTGEKVRVLDPKREPRRVRRHGEDNRPFPGNARVHLFEEYVPVRVDVAEGIRVGAGFAVVAVQEVYDCVLSVVGSLPLFVKRRSTTTKLPCLASPN